MITTSYIKSIDVGLKWRKFKFDFAKYIKSRKARSQMLIAAIVVALLFPVLIIMGIDKSFIKSSMSGRVVDQNGNAVANAEITIQGQLTSTDEDGNYRLEKLVYGKHEYVIKKAGYEYQSGFVSLKRFSNPRDFTLRQEQSGFALVNLLPTSGPLQRDQLTVLINDSKITENSEGRFDTGRLLLGRYKLKIQSPYYVDQEREIDIIPGELAIQVDLVQAADVTLGITDFLTATPLLPDNIVYFKDKLPVKIDLTDQSGIFVAKELEKTGKLKIKIEKNGYHPLEKEIELKQGPNVVSSIVLVPQGKIALTTSVNGKTVVVGANYDGSEQSVVFEYSGECTVLFASASFATYRCGNEIKHLRLTGEKVEIVANIAGLVDPGIYDRVLGKVIFVDNASEEKIYYMDKEVKVVLYKSSIETVTGLKSGSSGEKFFTTTDKLFAIKTDGSGVQEIRTGQYLIESVSPDGAWLVASNKHVGGDSLWVIKTSNGEITKINTNASQLSGFQFLNSQKFAMLNVSEKKVYLGEVGQTNLQQTYENVRSFYVIEDTNYLMLDLASGKGIYNLGANYLAKLSS